MQEMLTLSANEQTRLVVLNELQGGRLRAVAGVGLRGLSGRQVRRPRAVYRREGANAVAHGSRRRRPHRALEDEAAQCVVALTGEKYVEAMHVSP